MGDMDEWVSRGSILIVCACMRGVWAGGRTMHMFANLVLAHAFAGILSVVGVSSRTCTCSCSNSSLFLCSRVIVRVYLLTNTTLGRIRLLQAQPLGVCHGRRRGLAKLLLAQRRRLLPVASAASRTVVAHVLVVV